MAASSALRVCLRARAAQKSHHFALQFPYFLSNLSYTGVGTMQLILGSSSASRRQILSEMGYKFTLLVGYLCSLCLRCYASVDSSPASHGSVHSFSFSRLPPLGGGFRVRISTRRRSERRSQRNWWSPWLMRK